MTLGEKINAANAEALKIILGAQPTLIGVGTAGEDIPGMTKKTILHSGPPVTWENMCDLHIRNVLSVRTDRCAG